MSKCVRCPRDAWHSHVPTIYGENTQLCERCLAEFKALSENIRMQFLGALEFEQRAFLNAPKFELVSTQVIDKEESPFEGYQEGDTIEDLNAVEERASEPSRPWEEVKEEMASTSIDDIMVPPVPPSYLDEEEMPYVLPDECFA